MCKKLHRFDYRDEAEDMADKLARKLPPRMKVYQCSECHLWCLTSGPLHKSPLTPEQVFSIIPSEREFYLNILETGNPYGIPKE